MEPKRERDLSLISVRQLEPDQWQIYKGLRLEMLHTDPLAFPPQAFKDLEAPEEKWRQNITDGIVLVAFEGNSPAGMVRGEYVGDKAVVRNMYTRLMYRGQGLGNGLMTELLSGFAADGRAAVAELEVNSTQQAALSVYQKFGFIETKRVPEENHFMITMEKQL